MNTFDIEKKIMGCVNCIRKYMSENCVNNSFNNVFFVIISISNNINSFSYKDIIDSVRDKECVNLKSLQKNIIEIQDEINWVDFIPYKIEFGNLYVITKFILLGKGKQPIRFHISYERFHHYPVDGQKYDLNYFWQISDEEYKQREKEYSKRYMKILKKYNRQKWIATRLKKCFNIEMKVLNLEDEIKRINVFEKE